jgi:hypothetical protein
MKRMEKIEIGQRFQSIGTVTRSPAYTYEVTALFRSKVDDVDYARLVQIGEPTQQKSISAAMLHNPRHFVPVTATDASPTRPA